MVFQYSIPQYQPPQYSQQINAPFQPVSTGYPNQASYLGLTKNQNFYSSILLEGKNIEETPISLRQNQINNTIPPTTITEDTTFAAIFSFDIDHLNTTSLFSRAIINQDKPITALYTDARIGNIDINSEEPLIEFKNTTPPPTIETYQVLWVDDFRTELPPPLTWEEKRKRKVEKLQSALYCDKCDFMFNPPPRILFPITELLELEEEEELTVKNMSFQDPTEETKTEQYFAYSDLSKELELKYTMVQVASRSSLAKKRVNIKEGIIDASYMENIIVILQNNLDQPYKIESQEKIVQAIFLFLVKIPQLILVTTQVELDLTAQKINGFGSSRRGNVPINFTEKDSNQIQDQALLFEANPEICSLADVANLYLLAKAHKHFKISIHNPTEDVIEISKRTLIGSILPDIQHSEKPQSIPDFAQLFLFCDITSQVWNLPKESYLFTPEEIHKLNLGNLSTLQQMQLKVLLNQYANIFASKNKFRCTDIIKHQINTENAQPIKQ
ncbi:hypothetical protein G9A89_011678 [Geosiphon pyriformis]|nr:hypothetical protein G9A89_011678 [Geosiphon pyriformis]